MTADAFDVDGQTKIAGFKPWLVVISAAMFFFYEFIQMNVINAINVDLMKAFSMTPTQLGFFSSSYFYATVMFLIPAAMILDRFSTKRVIITALGICVAGNLMFSYASTVPLLVVSRFFTGIGSAFCFLSCIRLATRWFPPAHLALVTGVVVTLAMTGGMVAQAPMTYLAEAYGWRQTMMMDGLFGIVVLLLIMTFVEDYPVGYKHIKETQEAKLSELGYMESLRISLLRKQNWLCGLYTCMLNLPIYLLGGFMGTPYLIEVQGYTRDEAAWVMTTLFLGATIGSPLMGWISDTMGLRRRPMIAGAVLSFFIVLAIMSASHASMTLMIFLFFSLGLVTSSQVISYPTVAESSPQMLTATSVSVVSITVISSGAIFQPIFGKLIDLHHGGQISGAYTASDLQFAMWIFPVCFLLGLILAVAIKETHCKATDKNWRALHG